MTISGNYSGSFVGCLLNIVLLLNYFLMTFKALNNLAPSYIGNLLHLFIGCPLNIVLLQVPPSNLKTYGDRAFSVCPPKLWKGLPYYIRSKDYQGKGVNTPYRSSN